MTIQELGSVGELLAAIATIATLIYLALQLRQNTAALKLSQIRAVDSDAQNSRGRFVENREVAELYIKGLTEPDSLDQADRLRFRMMLDQLFFDWQGQIFLYDTNPAAADRFIAGTLATPGGKLYWEKTPHEIFEAEFVEHVNRILTHVAKT
jgi:hypothetical protein